MNTFLLLKIFLESLLRDISAQLSMPNHYYQACKYPRQTMTGRIAISFPDVDANKSANNPNKPVQFIIERPFLIPPACRSPHCPEWNRAFIVLGILGASFTRRGYIARAELGYERSSSQIPNSHARIFMERRESWLRYICIVYTQRPLL